MDNQTKEIPKAITDVLLRNQELMLQNHALSKCVEFDSKGIFSLQKNNYVEQKAEINILPVIKILNVALLSSVQNLDSKIYNLQDKSISTLSDEEFSILTHNSKKILMILIDYLLEK